MWISITVRANENWSCNWSENSIGLLLPPGQDCCRPLQILPARIMYGLRRARRRFSRLQRSARATGTSDGSITAKEYFAIQTYRVRLRAKHNLLWRCRASIFRIWNLAVEMAGATGCGLLDDRIGSPLGGAGKLFGKPEI